MKEVDYVDDHLILLWHPVERDFKELTLLGQSLLNQLIREHLAIYFSLIFPQDDRF